METLLRGLSPAYLRLGGASADHLVFSNQPADVFKKSSAISSFNSKYVNREGGGWWAFSSEQLLILVDPGVNTHVPKTD